MIWLAFLATALAGTGVWLWRARARRARRAALLAERLTDEERAVVARLVPLTARMPAALRARLEGKMVLFMDQVAFYGAGGLEVSDEMQLAIAAQACILVAGNEDWYETLRTIIIYPGAFKSRHPQQDGYVVTERDEVRVGESWSRGPVILSWADSERGAFVDDDGHNVVFHEFAHQLDDASGAVDGFPVVGRQAAAWAEAFDEAFERSNRLLDIGKRPFLDPYGATAPEEMFAVAVEAFFETPRDMARAEPAIYRELSRYFRQDPAAW
ncbi:MAG: M90 family metallopeptidase [Pseudomonadota bacterium]